MLMKDDKKKTATLIIAKMKNGDKMRPAPQVDGAEMAEPDEMDMAADELLRAIEKKDARAVKECMRSMIELVSNSEPKEEEEMNSEEESED